MGRELEMETEEINTAGLLTIPSYLDTVVIIEPEIEVDSICVITNSGNAIVGNDEFAINSGHSDIVEKKYINKFTRFIIFGKTVRVLYIKTNPLDLSETITIVETIDSRPSTYLKFMVNIKGLKKKKTHGEILSAEFLKEYLSGKEIIKQIPDDCITELTIGAIIFKNPLDIQFVSEGLVSDVHYMQVLRKDGGLLGLIPANRRTLELCRVAIKEEPFAEKFIPEELRCLVK